MFRRVATIDGGVAAVVKRLYATRAIFARLGSGLERPGYRHSAAPRREGSHRRHPFGSKKVLVIKVFNEACTPQAELSLLRWSIHSLSIMTQRLKPGAQKKPPLARRFFMSRTYELTNSVVN
jgi:hypothetical protein